MNVLNYVEKQPPGSKYTFVIKGENLYPRMISEIMDTIKDGPNVAHAMIRQQGLGDNPIGREYLARALRVPPDVWKTALEEPRTRLGDEGLAWRKEALEIARLWFTELLHITQEHQPMAIRILKAPKNMYRWAI